MTDYLIFIDWPHAENLPEAFHEGQGGYACVGHVPTNDGAITTMCVYNCTPDMLVSPHIVVVGELNSVVDEEELKLIDTPAENVTWIKNRLSLHTNLPPAVINNMDLSTTFQVVTRCSVFFGFPPGQAFQELQGLEV